MKTINKLNIIFIILASITGGLGLGFLIDALVLGYNDANGMIFGIVSAVSFILCIAFIVTIICINIVGIQRKNKDKQKSTLIILPSKKNISFDVRDVNLFRNSNEEKQEEDFACLIETDLHSCATCKEKSLKSELKKIKENQIKNKKKHLENIHKLEKLISGVSKDTNLIILKQKQKGKIFVPGDFVEWPANDILVVDVINNDIQNNIEEQTLNIDEQILTDKAILKILNSKKDVANIEEIIETFEVDEIPMESDDVIACDNEDVTIQGPVVEDNVCENCECYNYVDNEIVNIEGPVVEDNICESLDYEIIEDINDEVVYIQGPVLEDNIIIEDIPTTTDDSIHIFINNQNSGLLEHNIQYVEWPATHDYTFESIPSKNLENDNLVVAKSAPIEEEKPIVNKVQNLKPSKSEKIIDEPKIIINDIPQEKEFVIEAEELFENEAIVGDDSRVFNDPEESEAVAMTLKKTITNSLFTGKQNVVFVKRPPVHLFTKIYIIDRATESIVGDAIVKIYERGLKKQIWNKYCKKSTITKEQFDTYYSSSLLACALVIKTVSKYTESIPISKYGINKVPSTFIYVID